MTGYPDSALTLECISDTQKTVEHTTTESALHRRQLVQEGLRTRVTVEAALAVKGRARQSRVEEGRQWEERGLGPRVEVVWMPIQEEDLVA